MTSTPKPRRCRCCTSWRSVRFDATDHSDGGMAVSTRDVHRVVSTGFSGLVNTHRRIVQIAPCGVLDRSRFFADVVAGHDHRRADRQIAIGAAADAPRQRGRAAASQHGQQPGDRAQVGQPVALRDEDEQLQRLVDAGSGG